MVPKSEKDLGLIGMADAGEPIICSVPVQVANSRQISLKEQKGCEVLITLQDTCSHSDNFSMFPFVWWLFAAVQVWLHIVTERSIAV